VRTHVPTGFLSPPAFYQQETSMFSRGLTEECDMSSSGVGTCLWHVRGRANARPYRVSVAACFLPARDIYVFARS